METTKYHRPGVRLDKSDKALLDRLMWIYGSEAQAIRVAIRTLAEKYPLDEPLIDQWKRADPELAQAVAKLTKENGDERDE